MVKDNVVKLSKIYVHSDSITTQSISQMTHFFCLNGPLDPKMQNLGENTAESQLKLKSSGVNAFKIYNLIIIQSDNNY